MVIATMSDVKSATINAIPRGFNMRPSIPERKKRGINATIIISVALMIDVRISFDASKTILMVDLPVFAMWFSLNLL